DPIYNFTIHCLEDLNPGSIVHGSIIFDLVNDVLNDVKLIQATVEELEYSVVAPNHESGDCHKERARRHHSLFHSKTHHTAGLSSHTTRTIGNPAVLYKNGVDAEPLTLTPGRHEFKFQLPIPADVKPTGATNMNNGDADLVLYRIHAEFLSGSYHHSGYHFVHVLPKAA
ncbi:hypothetical protein HDV05_002499, partial [Chytridiales sp. JEL 0842]